MIRRVIGKNHAVGSVILLDQLVALPDVVDLSIRAYSLAGAQAVGVVFVGRRNAALGKGGEAT